MKIYNPKSTFHLLGRTLYSFAFHEHSNKDRCGNDKSTPLPFFLIPVNCMRRFLIDSTVVAQWWGADFLFEISTKFLKKSHKHKKFSSLSLAKGLLPAMYLHLQIKHHFKSLSKSNANFLMPLNNWKYFNNQKKRGKNVKFHSWQIINISLFLASR